MGHGCTSDLCALRALAPTSAALHAFRCQSGVGTYVSGSLMWTMVHIVEAKRQCIALGSSMEAGPSSVSL